MRHRTLEPLGDSITGRRLNYRGDQTTAVGQILGPNTFGEWWVITAATYDSTTDRTVVELRPARDADLASAVPA